MATSGTLLCIHRDPGQLSYLQKHGYELVTAANGREGLRLFMSRPVDAVVLEYHLRLLDGATLAEEIKQVHPETPVVMLADHAELPQDDLQSVDAIVAKTDGPHFLWATVHFVLNAGPETRIRRKSRRPNRAITIPPANSFSAKPRTGSGMGR